MGFIVEQKPLLTKKCCQIVKKVHMQKPNRTTLMKNIILLIAFLTFIPAYSLYASDGFTQRDRELLVELKVKMHEIDKRFEQVDKRIDRGFEQIDRRFEQVDKRFEQVDKRFDDMFNFLWILTGIFTTLTVSVIGFAYWDRRTMIRKAKEETI